MTPLQTFFAQQTGFHTLWDPNIADADCSREPVIFPDTDLPVMFFRIAPTPVTRYTTTYWNPIGEFPIERVMDAILDIVDMRARLDISLLGASRALWPNAQSPPEDLEILQDAQRFLFGALWVGRDFLLQILRDFDIAGATERRHLASMLHQGRGFGGYIERHIMFRLAC
ncbi:hypothetical protein CLAFUW4_08731 [Fulvia fulva]|uniref:Uncharacterized protein n=1 Tax=Passalora fulva TaxID=5499 RepID=A0A9Q8UTP8_PASFU|nr:uncharacterized protein CLAFUR5_08828 [Fulvia fulva]KAK4614253.1 hypothetical protein CLAFUR4_08736 [Fulvia fulva]KAK4615107.1 hypothetical protein CLAFUR0_08731 [Fulvia fulva]UJO22045.1 hypothetical protein CLAFUR5_08828 [Fulvia fulva]WPV19975.1 hypothetical protein CLAFUW4_08731 [Fulvia fulva]WPV35565.1 hypothetical protein CLAFUW7_08731 [Fulvia fulva]